MSRNEAKTRKELIDPKLKESGWFENDWQIDPEYKITAGRIHFDGGSAKRAKPVYADYLLRYASSKAIAIVEAKREELSHLEGEKQAKSYATKLGLWFTYSTNGHEIEFYNLRAGTQETIKEFHTPDQLWDLYLKESGLDQSPEKILALTHDYYDESAIGQRRKPRYYQELAVNNAIEAVVYGKKRVLLTMATGTGKTFTSIQLVYKLWKAKVVKKILFIVDRNLLADQAFADFDNAMDKDACYRISPQDDVIPKGRDLYFGIYQSLVGYDDEGEKVGRPNRFEEFDKDYFDLIVIDEAHRGARRSQDGKEQSSWYKLLEHFDSAIQVGLTATPRRDESNDTYSHFGEPVVVYSLKDGIQDGFLAPYIIKRVTSNIDALGYRPDSAGITDVRGKELTVKDYLTPDFERRLSIPQRTRAFAYHLLRHQFSTDPSGKTIVFCLNQEHALDMAKYCREAFAKYKVKYGLDYNGEYAVRITGADKDAKGKYADLEKFQDLNSKEPVIVTTSKLLTTGVDVKNVRNVVIFRNVGSMVEFKQIIGRGTRTYEHEDKRKEKLGFYILEYANYSTQLFNDPDWDDEPVDFINEGAIVVDEEAPIIDPENSDESEQVTGEAEVPVAQTEEEVTNVDSNGIWEEPDPTVVEDMKFRMSEDFLMGRVKMVAESVSLTGPDGKPMSSDDYVLFQSKMFMEGVSDLSALNQIWTNAKSRKEFIEQTSTDMGVSIANLTNIFFEKHGVRDVDTYDILASLVFGQKYLTKDERINKARALRPEVFDLGSEDQNELVADILEVYKDMEYKSLSFSHEFYQIPQMQKHGGFKGILDTLGGMDKTKAFISNFQETLYDERIAA